MSRWRKLLWIALVPVTGASLFGLTGCQDGLVSIDQPTEIRIGQQAAADIEAQYGVVNDPVQTPRVQRIGRAIAAVTTRPTLPWTFKILNTTEVNAFSLPGGPVYVTRGLLSLNIPDNELAGVIGHEVAHIQDRDSVHAIERAMTYQLLAELVLGQSSSALRAAADLAVEYAIQLPKSRDAEYASDSAGIRLAYNAGYPANGLLLFLQRLQAMQGRQQTPEWLSTHPLTAERVTRAEQIVAQVSGQPRPVPVVLIEVGEKRNPQPVPASDAVERTK